MTRIVLTLLGTGSSGGVPRIGNDWGACDPDEPRNRRRRCSALVEAFSEAHENPTRVLIDTSIDLREQMLSAKCDRLDAVVFTHDHADQTHGLDDIRQLVLTQSASMPIYMDAPTASTLIPKFRYCFEGSKGYPPILDRRAPLKAYEPIEVTGEGPPVTFLPLDQDHGPIRSLGFRLGDLAYCNDLRALPSQSKERLAGLSTLVIDSLRRSPHPTHFNLDEAVEIINELRPQRAVLTNMHVDLDYQTLRRELPDHIEPGFDGMRISGAL